MSNKIPFIPIKGLESEINQITTITEGNLYFATDSGKIFFDTATERKVMGGAGVSVFFASDDEVITNLSTNTFKIHQNKIKTTTKVNINDLIINADGRFFKVISIDGSLVICSLIAVSGTGGGGGSSSSTGGVQIEFLQNMFEMPTFLYGVEKNISFIPKITGDNNEDTYFSIKWTIVGSNDNYIKTGTLNRLKKDEIVEFDLGSKLYEGINSRIIFKITGLTSGLSYEYNQFENYTAIKMGLKLASGTIQNALQQKNYTVRLNLTGVTEGQTLEYYIDNTLQQTVELENLNSTVSYDYNLENLVSGLHSFKIIYAFGDLKTEPLIIPFAYVDVDSITKPIIWFSADSTTKINQYETIILKYQVYFPSTIENGDTVLIKQQINDKEPIEQEIPRNPSNFIDWKINNYNLGYNTFTLSYGEVKESIQVYVERSSRNLTPIQGALINFDPVDRSNYETKAARATWGYNYKITNEPYNAIFDRFNWKYNGWMLDNNNNNILRLNNGASFTIPLPGQFVFGSDNDNLTANTFNLSGATFEFRFKISNVKNYKPLIQNITQFLVDDGSENGVWKNESSLSEDDIIKQNTSKYDILQVIKQINATEDDGFIFYFSNTNNIIKGFVLGAEEAFFTSGGQTVNVKYQKDEIINLSIVVGPLNEVDTTSNLKSLKIYLNGVLSGIVQITDAFKIENNIIKFTSQLCDVDLYKFRFYDYPLTMNEIMFNYIADTKNVLIYDQNQIFTSKIESEINSSKVNYDNTIDFQKLQDYNNNPARTLEELTMCYGVLSDIKEKKDNKEDTVIEDRLPVFKGNKVTCTFEFFNPYLDKSIDDGMSFNTAVSKFFPSFKASNVSLDVQGTSSQGYPRRNYKAKFDKATLVYNKDPDKVEYSKDNIAFHLDSSENTTNVFTWKVDYMDSSSAHNTGLANITNSFYSKHPLDYYPDVSGAGYRTTIYGFPIILFQKHTYEDGQEEYEFIGKYNFNLDKSSNDYFGFEADENNSIVNKKYKNIAECWEIKNNQGTWTSFKLPPGSTLDSVKDEHPDVLEITDYFEYRRLPKAIDLGGFAKQKDFLDEVYERGKGKTGEFADLYDALTQTQIINKQKEIHSNLYTLIEWLNSTDIETADPTRELRADETKTFYVSEPFMKLNQGYTGKETNKNDIYENTAYDNNPGEGVPRIKYYKFNLDESGMFYNKEDVTDSINAANFEIEKNKLFIDYDPNRSQNKVVRYTLKKDFTHDDVDYRKAKFNAEFDKHLNKEYCFVYYILTELLLMYDSRGKNMMLASWGPVEEGGEYIWFPIFYDLDTQLGLNNSGIPTYNYDTDATESNAFSTSNSVLWNNLLAVFGPEIAAKYIELRENKLDSQTKLEQGYNYTSNSNSYVMKGVRPLCIHNADEYYKYLAPMTVGYWNTSGDLVKDNKGEYLYACQGTRESYRRSLLKNRLNYIDSYWKAGPYSAEKSLSSYWMRINGNDAINTSDSGDMDNIDLDASPNFSITPYLNQYLTVGYDKIYTPQEKSYASIPKTIPAINSLTTKFNGTDTISESLVYIPGTTFIKSLGDLSNKYISEWHFSSESDIQDFILGNDAENYENKLIKGKDQLAGIFTELPLLEKIVLTGLTVYAEAIDVQGCPKLKEFRALRTQIPSIKFQEGTVISKLHLPKTVTSLELLSAIDLTELIQSRYDSSNNLMSYKTFAQKEGLYVEGLFDHDNTEESKSELNTLKFENDNLGLLSYLIMQKLIEINESRITENKKTLTISMKDITWTPYEIIEIDEELPEHVYQKTTYHTFEEVTEEEDLITLLTNKKLYKLNTIENYPITSLEFFQSLRENDYISEFTLSGEIYIKNDIEINAEDLDNLEKEFAGTKFFAQNVNKGIEVQFLNEDGSIYLIENKTIKTEEETGREFITINKINTNPSLKHYEFQYWELIINPGENLFPNDIISINVFLDNYNPIKIRPYFKKEEYSYVFYYGEEQQEGNTILLSTAPQKVEYQKYLNSENINIPVAYKDASNLQDHPINGPARYAFRGYVNNVSSILVLREIDNLPTNLITLSDFDNTLSEKDENYYAVFQEEYLWNASGPDDESSFFFIKDSDNTYAIGLNKKLQGKILLPCYHYDSSTNKSYPVTKIIAGYEENVTNINLKEHVFNSTITNYGKDITHIYWYENESDPNAYCQLTAVLNYAFKNLNNLQYFQFNSRLDNKIWDNNKKLSIGQEAFYGTSLINESIYATSLGTSSLNSALKTKTLNLYAINSISDSALSNWVDETNKVEYELYLGDLTYPFIGGQNHFNNLGDNVKSVIKELYWKYNDKDMVISILRGINFVHENVSLHYIDINTNAEEDITSAVVNI